MNCLIRALLLAFLTLASISSAKRDLLVTKKECRNYRGKKLVPPGSKRVLRVRAEGFRTFWCNDSELYRTPNGRLHAQAEAQLYSLNYKNEPNGKCEGFHSYRENYGDGSTDGMPFFDIKCEGEEERNILAKQRPHLRKKAPKDEDGTRSPLTYSRRKVVEDENRGKSPKIHWVVRTRTQSGPVPTSCNGDIDEIVPFVVDFTFYTCKYAE